MMTLTAEKENCLPSRKDFVRAGRMASISIQRNLDLSQDSI
jgi:hypothetical protein